MAIEPRGVSTTSCLFETLPTPSCAIICTLHIRSRPTAAEGTRVGLRAAKKVNPGGYEASSEEDKKKLLPREMAAATDLTHTHHSRACWRGAAENSELSILIHCSSCPRPGCPFVPLAAQSSALSAACICLFLTRKFNGSSAMNYRETIALVLHFKLRISEDKGRALCQQDNLNSPIPIGYFCPVYHPPFDKRLEKGMQSLKLHDHFVNLRTGLSSG